MWFTFFQDLTKLKIPSENTPPLLEPKLDRDCKAKLQTRLYNLFDKDSWGPKVKESKSILEMLKLWNPRMYSSMNDLEFLVLLEVFEAHLQKRPFKIFLCKLGMKPHMHLLKTIIFFALSCHCQPIKIFLQQSWQKLGTFLENIVF